MHDWLRLQITFGRITTIQLLAVLAALLLSPPSFAAMGAPPESAQIQIGRLLSASPHLRRGHVGFEFVDAETGELLAAQGSDQFFTPASNTKLYTTAVALERLGVNYQFKTSIRTTAKLAPGQAVIPNVTLIGGGDPNLSGRILPFSEDAQDNSALAAIDKLADQIAQRGIRRISGDVIGDDTRYPYDPYPDGWTFDDALWYYGAPVSALSVNDNSVRLTVRATEVGALADICLQPDVGYFVVLNQVVTDNSAANHVTISRPAGSNELVLSGTIGRRSRQTQEDIAVADPALFAAQALRQALEERGVTIDGEARALHRDLNNVTNPLGGPLIATTPSGTELASLESAPLWQIVQVINKVSQNLHAEMLLREVGYATRNVGTLAAGLGERQNFLQQAGISTNDYDFSDGSGLARQGLTTPASTVALLRYMWARPEKKLWLESLPVGGVDGSLRRRFNGLTGGDRVHAKTGSLSHVSALSGYLLTNGGRWIAFSMMANAELNDSPEVTAFFDRACAIFLQQPAAHK
jgi:D-alanyl-D-alanine carboxypeptidase/D-alanyl-D-alanine-endopeptidase (penicillin-binding protein 4)